MENSSSMLPLQGHRLLQIGVALLVFSSFEGFAIPYAASPRLGLSVHTLSALQGVLLLAGAARGTAVQETVIKVVAYSSAPTGLISLALILWGLRVGASEAPIST